MMSNNNSSLTIEKWEGVLLPGQLVTYKLKTSINQHAAPYQTDYICFKISNLNVGEENNISNNNSCAVLGADDFKFANIYPNPVKDSKLTLAVIVPAEDDLKIDIYDNAGKIVLSQQVKAIAGFNLFNVETPNFQNGNYSCKLTYRTSVLTKQFMKSKN